MFCANIDISDNHFENNYGCGNAVGGVIRFQCIKQSATSTGDYDQYADFSIGDEGDTVAEAYFNIDTSTANFPDTNQDI